MDKKTVKLVMIVAILLTVALYFVGGTYARYTSEFTGEGKVDVAAWQVKLTNGADEAGTKLDLTLTPDAAEGLVVEGKIAPSYTASGKAEITLDGTEVAVDVIAEVDQESLATALETAGLKTPAEDFKVTLTATAKDSAFTIESDGDGSEEKPFVIKLPENKAFDATDILEITISVKWDNKDDASNTENTQDGEASYTSTKTLKVPVTLTVQQHIESV